MASKTVRVTQTRSAIGRLGSQRKTLIGLGLHKISEARDGCEEQNHAQSFMFSALPYLSMRAVLK